MRSTVLLSLLALPLVACGGSPDPGGDVVGTWKTHVFADGTPTATRTVTFGADGTASQATADGFDWHGRYRTADGQLTLITGDGPDPLEQTSTYLADGDHLLLNLFTPDDDGDDAIATWTAIDTFGISQLTATLILRDDHTMHFDQQGVTDRDIFDGTWSQDGEEITLTLVRGDDTAHLQIAMFEGYLGALYDRQ
jgi:hypothetical protein